MVFCSYVIQRYNIKYKIVNVFIDFILMLKFNNHSELDYVVKTVKKFCKNCSTVGVRSNSSYKIITLRISIKTKLGQFSAFVS